MKEMHIIRYADDFRIFCRTKEDAVRTKEAGILIGAVSIRLIIKISVLSWIPSDHICLINLL